MPNAHHDQAAGLRRMMTDHQPKIVSVLSTTEHKPSLMTNLAASISKQDCDVLVVHTTQTASVDKSLYGIKSLPTLVDVAHKELDLAQSVKEAKFGFLVAKLYASQQQQLKNTNADVALDKTFEKLTSLFEVTLVDTALDNKNQLPLSVLNQHEIIIQLTCDVVSIKQAYTMIKQIYSNVGRRSFGIIVSDATDKQAAKAFRNIAQVAKNHMQIELEFFGAIPSDEHLGRAAKLGRAIIDAFPLTHAAKAINSLAQRLNYKHPANVSEPELVSLI